MSFFPQISIKHNIGNIIEIPNQLNASVFTYMSENLPIGVTTIPVDNAIDFSSGTLIAFLGAIGLENAEFSYASAHTDQSITVAATKMPHNRGDLVTQVNYDQVVILKSSTIGGSYSNFATLNLFVTQQQTVSFDANGLTTDYYKVQWKNSQTGNVSELSDPISVLSYPLDSVGSIIFPVLRSMGVSENDNKITTQFCIDSINDAREYTRMKLYGIRHGWLSQFEYPIKVLAGSNFVELPDDIDFDETDRSLLSARFLLGNVLAPFNLRYVDKRSWNQTSWQVMGGLTTTETAISATTIDVNSSGDFLRSSVNGGVAYIATTDFDQLMLQIQYTNVNVITNQLEGVTGVDRIIPAGTQVWVTPSIAQPLTYTVYDNKIWFDRILPDSIQGNNLYIDYYRKFTKVENLYQELPEPYREIYKWYLKYAIKYRRDNTLSTSDPDYVKFDGLVDALFQNLYTGQDTIIVTS